MEMKQKRWERVFPREQEVGGDWEWIFQWPSHLKHPLEVYGHKFKVGQDSWLVRVSPEIFICVGSGLERQRDSICPGLWLCQATKRKPERGEQGNLW